MLLLNSVFTVVSYYTFYDSCVVGDWFFTRSLPHGPSSASKTLAAYAFNLSNGEYEAKQNHDVYILFTKP